MRYLSVCSGIGSDHIAWGPLGWQCVGFAEIEPFASAVLAHRFDGVPNFGDFTCIEPDRVGVVDVLVGGTPCQSFSVAGLRAGLADARGNLALEFVRLARRCRARWVVWENVPGVLSSDGGRAFGSILGAFRECGYSLAYRVLDAQYFGVPQRRRRVFVVGCLGADWRPPAAVLFESSCGGGGSAASRASEPNAATCTSASVGGRDLERLAGQSTVFSSLMTKSTRLLTASRGPYWIADLLAFDGDEGGDGPSGSVANPLRGGNRGAVAYSVRTAQTGSNGHGIAADVAHTLDGASGQALAICPARGSLSPVGYTLQRDSRLRSRLALQGPVARRLTPIECERLQGLPDDHTLVPYRGRLASDTPRYQAIGNGMAVPVLRFIGDGIARVEREGL